MTNKCYITPINQLLISGGILPLVYSSLPILPSRKRKDSKGLSFDFSIKMSFYSFLIYETIANGQDCCCLHPFSRDLGDGGGGVNIVTFALTKQTS